MESDEQSQLVDVRTTEEFGVSHLKDAQNICVTDADFQEKIKDLDKTKPVYVYCRSGGRSARAAKILEENGFTKVYDLQGGITSWDEQGLETEQ
ncbi:rhodanese-like domain-containing protein [Marixanthomonas ophiurae]|nr:rhodanese-like domain-containing protein [Marixanthomonas ophiurae]